MSDDCSARHIVTSTEACVGDALWQRGADSSSCRLTQSHGSGTEISEASSSFTLDLLTAVNFSSIHIFSPLTASTSL